MRNEAAARPKVWGEGHGGVQRLLRWVSLLDLIACLLAVASVLLSWQTSLGSYPGGTYSYHYYVYGTQCAQFGSASSCTPATDLPVPLRATEYLAVSVVPIALVGAVLGRIAGHAPVPSRRSATLSAGLAGAGVAGAVSATVLYAQYTYAHGTGLWVAPSTGGLGWDFAVLAAIVLSAALALSLWARWMGGRPAPRRAGRDRVAEAVL